MTRAGADTVNVGKNIIIVGLIVQIIIFSLFAVTAIVFHKRMRANPTSLARSLGWELHLYVLYGASVLIMVRSIFRLIEYAGGRDGYLMSHEVFLYVFDSTPMFICMAVFAWYHPSEINAILKGGDAKAVRNVFEVYSLAEYSTV